MPYDNSVMLELMNSMHKLLKEQGQDPYKCEYTATTSTNDLKSQILKAQLEAKQLRQHDPNFQYQYTKTKVEGTDYDNKESLIKEIDENEDIPPMPDKWPWDYHRWKDYCKKNNITNKDTVEIQDNGYVIKDGFDREIKRIPPTDSRIKKKKGEKVNNQPVDVEKLLSALEKIANKLLDYEYFDAKNIFDLKEYITSDYRIIKGTHLDKKNINQLIYRIDRLINDAEDYLDANELMILYFGIYLARIKNKEIRNKGARKIVNTIIHPPVQDLI